MPILPQGPAVGDIVGPVIGGTISEGHGDCPLLPSSRVGRRLDVCFIHTLPVCIGARKARSYRGTQASWMREERAWPATHPALAQDLQNGHLGSPFGGSAGVNAPEHCRAGVPLHQRRPARGSVRSPRWAVGGVRHRGARPRCVNRGRSVVPRPRPTTWASRARSCA